MKRVIIFTENTVKFRSPTVFTFFLSPQVLQIKYHLLSEIEVIDSVALKYPAFWKTFLINKRISWYNVVRLEYVVTRRHFRTMRAFSRWTRRVDYIELCVKPNFFEYQRTKGKIDLNNVWTESIELQIRCRWTINPV